jgi:hypothetical protein
MRVCQIARRKGKVGSQELEARGPTAEIIENRANRMTELVMFTAHTYTQIKHIYLFIHTSKLTGTTCLLLPLFLSFCLVPLCLLG